MREREKPKILIAEDNQDLADILCEYVKKEGFIPFVASDGQEALNIFYNEQLDIVLLDVTMPKINGFEVCQKIRKTSKIPIIIITAHKEEYECIMGLNIGADDYITKPFSMAETMARIHAVLRRTGPTAENVTILGQFLYDNLSISLYDYAVSIDSKYIELSRKEVELLYLMATNPKKIFTRENLMENIWGHNFDGYDRNIDTRIKRLRDKIDKVQHPKWKIKTIWGVGYQFVKVVSDEV